MSIVRNWIIKLDVIISLLVILVSLAFYIATLAPTVLWGDDAAYQTSYYLVNVISKLNSHPLWIIMAYPFSYLPFGDIAYRANLVSAVFGALTLCLVYLVTRYYSKSVPSRIIATAILGISHTFWQHCVRAEVYTFNAFFFVCVWFLLLKWRKSENWKWLAFACLCFLISLGNHLQMIVSLPGYIYLAIGMLAERARQRRIVLISIVSIVIFGFVVLFQPFLRGVILVSLNDTLSYIWPPRYNLHTAAIGAAMLLYNFVFSVPIVFAGLVRLWKRRQVEAYSLMLLVFTNAAVAFSFDVDADYVYYMPAYIALAVACAPGMDWLKERFSNIKYVYVVLFVVFFPLIIYRVTPIVLNRMDTKVIAARDLPGRDAETYFLWPSKRDYRGAREYGEAALNEVPPDSLILADGTICKTLWYLQQAEGMRPDVLVVLAEPYFGTDAKYFVVKTKFKQYTNWRLLGSQSQFLVEQGAYRPKYLANNEQYYDIKNISKHFDILPFGPIYELRSKK